MRLSIFVACLPGVMAYVEISKGLYCDSSYILAQHAGTDAACRNLCDSSTQCNFYTFYTVGWCQHMSACVDEIPVAEYMRISSSDRVTTTYAKHACGDFGSAQECPDDRCLWANDKCNTCADFTSEENCPANGCHWSNNTCQVCPKDQGDYVYSGPRNCRNCSDDLGVQVCTSDSWCSQIEAAGENCPRRCGVCNGFQSISSTPKAYFPGWRGEYDSSRPTWETRRCYPHTCASTARIWTTGRTLTAPSGVEHDDWQEYVVINYTWGDDVKNEDNPNLSSEDKFKAGWREAVKAFALRTCVVLLEQEGKPPPPYVLVRRGDQTDLCGTDSLPRPSAGAGQADRSLCPDEQEKAETGTDSCEGQNGKEYQDVRMQCSDTLLSVGTMMHELGHVLGIGHIQNRMDGPGTYFSKGPNHQVADEDKDPANYMGSADDGPGDPHIGYADYDILSVMHYPGYNDSGVWSGQRRAPSDGDIAQLIDMYQCKKKPGAPERKVSDGLWWHPQWPLHRSAHRCNNESGTWIRWTDFTTEKGNGTAFADFECEQRAIEAGHKYYQYGRDPESSERYSAGWCATYATCENPGVYPGTFPEAIEFNIFVQPASCDTFQQSDCSEDLTLVEDRSAKSCKAATCTKADDEATCCILAVSDVAIPRSQFGVFSLIVRVLPFLSVAMVAN